jgi:hypothetical protein
LSDDAQREATSCGLGWSEYERRRRMDDKTEAGMTLTRGAKELVQKRVGEDPEFAAAPLREGIGTMLVGDMETGKAILRDYTKATA